MKDFINLLFPLPSYVVNIIIFLSSTIVSLLGYMGITYFVAARKFQDIIRNELEGLFPTPTKWPKDSIAIYYILEEKYPRLENAVHKFRGHLPCFLLKSFDNAWLQYHKDYYQYMPIISTSLVDGKEITTDTTNTFKTTFKTNVENLLKYAKQI